MLPQLRRISSSALVNFWAGISSLLQRFATKTKLAPNETNNGIFK